MKFRNTWILAGIAIALGLYVYFVEIKKSEKDEAAKTQAEKVLSIDGSKLKAITIKNANGELKLESDGTGTHWKITAPVPDNGDDDAIKGMVNGLTGEKFDDTIEGEDPKNFGLDNPKSVVTLTEKDGKSQTVKTGIDAPLPGKAYLQREGENKILLATSSFKANLEKQEKDLRDKRVFRGEKDEIKHLTLKDNSKDNKVLVRVDNDGKNWVLPPKNELADGDTVKGVIDNVTSLRAVDFPSEKGADSIELKKYSLDRPELEITLDGSKGAIGTLDISPKKDNNVYAHWEGQPTVYQLFVSATDSLHKKADDFRDKKRPFQFNKDDVSDLTLKTSLTNLHLIKKGASWELAESVPDKAVSQIQVTNLLDKLSSLKVSEFLSPKEKAKGLNPPEHQVILKNTKGEDVFTMAWGDKTKSGRAYFAKTNKTPEIVGADSVTIDALPAQTLVETKAPSPSPGASAGGSGAAGSSAKPGTVTESGTAGIGNRATESKPALPEVKGPEAK